MKPDILLPNRTGIGENETFQNLNNLVIIGANGAGKTRLGTWVEQKLHGSILVHRISAQKALMLPEYTTSRSLEQVEQELLYGHFNKGVRVELYNKNSSRWGNNPDTFLLNDYDKLLSTLFAHKVKRDSNYTRLAKETKAFIQIPDSPTDIIEGIWADIMPQRQVYFDDGKVLVKKDGFPDYNGKEMSDGERVTLYLIGQCLCVPDNSIIIIDEPELHLHCSLMSRLWNKIEEVCPNKLLVYITHDLDFAASRKGATKIWIKEFGGNEKWIWEEIPQSDEIPESLFLEIIGNRKSILFSEGEKGGYDDVIYQAVYPNFHVIPRGGCEKVIESTRAMRSLPALHHLQAYGIVDGDYRTSEEINSLESSNIFTLDFAEIENVFCIELLIRLIAENQSLNPDETVEKVTTFIIDELQKEIETQVVNRAEKEIQFRLNSFSKKANSEEGLQLGLTDVLSNINVNEIYSESKVDFGKAIEEKNLNTILKIYNRKTLSERISPIFGLAKGQYIEIILRLLKSERKQEVVDALKSCLPQFPD